MSPSINLLLFQYKRIPAIPLEAVLMVTEDDVLMVTEDDIQLIIEN